MMPDITHITSARTARFSSWDKSGRNEDAWYIEPGEARVLADIQGPGCITHIWMTQFQHYRDCLLRMTWDDAAHPSVVVPLGDFFCLGHGIVNSFQSLLFSASAFSNNRVEGPTFKDAGCALNCYAPMPFAKRALIELVNESKETHRQFFYVDYETYDKGLAPDTGYFHAEFRRENPFGGWGHEIQVNSPESHIANEERLAWDNNYVILETQGRGHYIGCNLSFSNFLDGWLTTEGDDMIWVDGYKWPPDLHGTGTEDYINQAWGMQRNAFLRNGSSVFERDANGYQTSYVFHLENPVRFQKEIKVTIECGHGNHLSHEMSSVAYWYADIPTRVAEVPPPAKRMRVSRDEGGTWLYDKGNQTTSKQVRMNAEMQAMKRKWHSRSS